jgi:curved DNA-binding protein CbpA
MSRVVWLLSGVAFIQAGLQTPWMQDHYSVLGLRQDADESQIKQNFRNLARTTHPDKQIDSSSDADAAEFIRLKLAYDTLKDEDTRRDYDHEAEGLLMVRECSKVCQLGLALMAALCFGQASFSFLFGGEVVQPFDDAGSATSTRCHAATAHVRAVRGPCKSRTSMNRIDPVGRRGGSACSYVPPYNVRDYTARQLEALHATREFEAWTQNRPRCGPVDEGLVEWLDQHESEIFAR